MGQSKHEGGVGRMVLHRNADDVALLQAERARAACNVGNHAAEFAG